MTIQLSDDMIGSLLAERKELPDDSLLHPKLKSKHGHKEFEREITGENGSLFRLVFRQSESNQLDFSIIPCTSLKDQTSSSGCAGIMEKVMNIQIRLRKIHSMDSISIPQPNATSSQVTGKIPMLRRRTGMLIITER